jgi:hypothetical protein
MGGKFKIEEEEQQHFGDFKSLGDLHHRPRGECGTTFKKYRTRQFNILCAVLNSRTKN